MQENKQNNYLFIYTLFIFISIKIYMCIFKYTL